MMRDENVEQLSIKPVRIFGDFLDLQTWLDIEVIADVAGLKIEINHADPAILVGFLQLEPGSDFNDHRGVADAARSRKKCDRRWLFNLSRLPHRGRCTAAPFGENLRNLLRRACD